MSSTTTILGGDLPHSVTLARADEDAFFRRLSPPPKLDEAPKPVGDVYTLESSYWDLALRNGKAERPATEDRAAYYPDYGYVRARQGGQDVWLVLDLRQRAILDRYISLTRAGLLRERPGILEVLFYAARSEQVAIDVGASSATDAERRDFWNALAVNPRPTFLDREQPTKAGVWIVFSLEDGRAVQLFYESASRRLTDFFGSEVYTLNPLLAGVLDTVIRGGGESLQIEQQEGRGSPVWWGVMISGGLVLFGIAVTLRRKTTASQAGTGNSHVDSA